jgi:UDP-GlcNAc:undecaprenyl-phosphate GlcNAc-1-phosphate transferase
VRDPSVEVLGILVAGGILLAVGIVDDFRPLSPKMKLLGQVVSALVFVLGYGVRIEFVTNPFGGMILLRNMSSVFTVIWIVAFANVINLIDGIDGLAAGVASIAATSLLFVAMQQGQGAVVALTAALAGSALGFLRYNFNPAKIFMGDAGAMFLGFALAAVSIEGTLKSAAAVAVVVPVMALGLPIFDTCFAIVRRVSNGHSIGQADRGHLHHRLLDMGFSQRQACFVMYALSAFLGLAAVMMSVVRARDAVFIVGFAGIVVLALAHRAGVLDIRDTKSAAKQ